MNPESKKVQEEELSAQLSQASDPAEESAQELSQPSRLSENYQILDPLGTGGMGCVVKAQHRMLGHYVAIKRIVESKNQTDSMLKRFTNEARAASLLNHENIAGLREFGIDTDGTPYAVMNFIEGKSLSSLIDSGEIVGDVSRCIQIAMQICKALEHAHENGVIHRDIKPSNIIIGKNPDGTDKAVIVDFGIAKITDAETSKLTQTGEVYGSPDYISPEQALGQQVDKRADIYSLGCVIFECLAGIPPYRGENAMQTAVKHINAPVPDLKVRARSAMPDGLADLVSICLQKEPDARFQTTAQLFEALDAINQGKKATIQKSQQKKLLLRRNRGLLIGAAIATVILLLLAAAMSSLRQQNQNAAPAKIELGDYAKSLPVSDFAKVAVNNDMGESFKAYQQGRYLESAYMLRNTNQILEDELTKINNSISDSSKQNQRRQLRRNRYTVQWVINENLVHIGKCFNQAKNYSEALPYLEKAISFFRADLDRERALTPSDQEAYIEYMNALRGNNDEAKLREIEQEWQAVQNRHR